MSIDVIQKHHGFISTDEGTADTPRGISQGSTEQETQGIDPREARIGGVFVDEHYNARTRDAQSRKMKRDAGTITVNVGTVILK